MKLNGGRGWEAVRAHPSQHNLHNVNANPEASNRALVGAPGVRDGRPSRDRNQISRDRLDAAQPPTPGSPAKPGAAALSKDARNRASASNNLPKRSSALAGQLDAGTPTASTQAQFQNSNANLVGQRPSPAAAGLQGNQRQPQEQQGGFMQKIMKALCCGR